MQSIKLQKGQPIIRFEIHLPEVQARLRKAEGIPVPSPVQINGLIDTGFTGGLALDQDLLKGWDLKNRNFNRIALPHGEEGRFFDTFAWETDLAVKFFGAGRGGRNVLWDPIPATRLEFIDKNIYQALIGQQILQAAVFVYNGAKDSFRLTFSEKYLRNI